MKKSLAADKAVCVTGASGFIASRLVADLLAAGYTVRGTVRNAADTEKYSFLTDLPGSENLSLVSANLLDMFSPRHGAFELVWVGPGSL